MVSRSAMWRAIHAYTTHSREPIEALGQLMGHWRIETTAGYNRSWVEPRRDQLADLRKLVANNARMLAPAVVRDLQHIASSPLGTP